jgi:hypothetical protein
MALAAAVLGERPSAAQLAGAVLVCIGVLAVARNAAPAGGRPDRDPQPPGIPPADTERSTVAGPASTGSALPAETSG